MQGVDKKPYSLIIAQEFLGIVVYRKSYGRQCRHCMLYPTETRCSTYLQCTPHNNEKLVAIIIRSYKERI